MVGPDADTEYRHLRHAVGHRHRPLPRSQQAFKGKGRPHRPKPRVRQQSCLGYKRVTFPFQEPEGKRRVIILVINTLAL